MLRYQLIESLPRIILYLYFFSLVDLAGLIRKAYREVFDRFVYDLVTLAVIIDPIGTAAIFAALSQSTPPGGRRAMAVRGTAIAAGICVAFAFGGEALLRAMGVSLAAFQAAGGALLFLLATDMVFAHESGLRQPTRAEADEAQRSVDISVLAPSSCRLWADRGGHVGTEFKLRQQPR